MNDDFNIQTSYLLFSAVSKNICSSMHTGIKLQAIVAQIRPNWVKYLYIFVVKFFLFKIPDCLPPYLI